MPNRLSKGKVLVGAIAVSGAVSAASAQMSASSTVFSGIGFSTASVVSRRLRISASCLSGVEADTGVVLPLGAVVKDCYVHVKTKEATGTTKTISVGLLSTGPGGMTAGFALGLSTASVQVLRGTMVAGSVTAGSLFQKGSGISVRFFEPFVTSGTIGLNVSYTYQSAHTECVADIILDYDQIIMA